MLRALPGGQQRKYWSRRCVVSVQQCFNRRLSLFFWWPGVFANFICIFVWITNVSTTNLYYTSYIYYTSTITLYFIIRVIRVSTTTPRISTVEWYSPRVAIDLPALVTYAIQPGWAWSSEVRRITNNINSVACFQLYRLESNWGTI